MPKGVPNPDYESAKSRLTAMLNRFYGETDLSELLNLLESIDDTVTDSIVKEVIGYLENTKPKAKRSTIDDALMLGGVFFRINAGIRDAESPSVLAVSVLSFSGVRKIKHVKVSVKLEECGRYQSLSAIVDPDFSLQAENIARFAQVILETGYRWIRQSIIQRVKALESALSIRLYGFLRPLLPAALAPWVWFVVISPENGGTYVFDQAAAESTLSLLQKPSRGILGGHLELFLHLLMTTVPFNQLSSRFAISSGLGFDVPLGGTNYRESASGYAIAEDTVYPLRTASVFPIVREGKSFLIAAYPTSYKSLILPVLEKNHDEFARIFKDERGLMKRFIARLRERKIKMPSDLFTKVVAGVTEGLANAIKP